MKFEIFLASNNNHNDASTKALELLTYLLAKRNQNRFLGTGDFSELITNQGIDVNCRIFISGKKDKDHPLLGSESIVINYDTNKDIAYVLYKDKIGFVSGGNPRNAE